LGLPPRVWSKLTGLPQPPVPKFTLSGLLTTTNPLLQWFVNMVQQGQGDVKYIPCTVVV